MSSPYIRALVRRRNLRKIFPPELFIHRVRHVEEALHWLYSRCSDYPVIREICLGKK